MILGDMGNGLLFFMEEDEAADPIDVGFFGAIGVVFCAEGIGELVEQFFCHGDRFFRCGV